VARPKKNGDAREEEGAAVNLARGLREEEETLAFGRGPRGPYGNPSGPGRRKGPSGKGRPREEADARSLVRPRTAAPREEERVPPAGHERLREEEDAPEW